MNLRKLNTFVIVIEDILRNHVAAADLSFLSPLRSSVQAKKDVDPA